MMKIKYKMELSILASAFFTSAIVLAAAVREGDRKSTAIGGTRKNVTVQKIITNPSKLNPDGKTFTQGSVDAHVKTDDGQTHIIPLAGPHVLGEPIKETAGSATQPQTTTKRLPPPVPPSYRK